MTFLVHERCGSNRFTMASLVVILTLSNTESILAKPVVILVVLPFTFGYCWANGLLLFQNNCSLVFPIFSLILTEY